MQPIDNEPMVNLNGVGVAHDLIEHVNGLKNIGSIQDELQALGAVWFTRGQWGDVSRNPNSSATAYESIGDDVAQLAIKFMSLESSVIFQGKIPKRTKKDYIQEELESCIEVAKTYIKDYGNDIDLYSDRCNTFFNIAGRLMQQGYDKIEKKFDKKIRANSLFWTIAWNVDQVMEPLRVQYNNLEIGEKFRLRYDPKGINIDGTTFERMNDF